MGLFGSKKRDSKKVKDYYEEMTSSYLDIYGDVIQAYRPASQDDLLEYLAKSIGFTDGQRVLDAGCGVGGPACFFAHHLKIRIDGITISPSQARLFSERVEREKLSERVNVLEGDFHFLESYFPKEQFDHVIFLESLGHSHQAPLAIQSAHRVLKPGGHIYIKDFFIREVSNPEFQKKIQRVVRNINQAYNYNTLDLHQVITAVRRAGFHLVSIKRPEFQNDITVRAAFETNHGIDLYEGGPEFMPAEWLEIKCQKLHW